MTELAPIDHTELDQESILDQLVKRIPTVAPQWTDRGESDIGRSLLELFAFVNNATLHRLDMTANELYLATARQRSSVIRLATLIGYKVGGNISSVANVTFERDSVGAEVKIPKFTRLSTEGDPALDFYTFEEASIEEASIGDQETSVKIRCVQGIEVQELFDGNGSLDNQELVLTHKDVAQNGTEVKVSDVVWTEVDNFLNSTSASEHYTFRFNADEQGVVQFGDGSFGKQVVSGTQNIEVNYLRSAGSSGNVGSDKITILQDSISDIDGDLVSLSVTNETPSVGGNDPETIESVKVNAPSSRAAGDRAVTVADYVALLESIPTITKAKAWGEKEVLDDKFKDEANPADARSTFLASTTDSDITERLNLFNQVYVTVAPNSLTPAYIGTPLREDIDEKLESSAILQTTHNVWHPTYVRVDVKAKLFTLRGFTISSVVSLATSALNDFFSLASRDFGQAIRFSNISNLLENTPGVRYIELDIRKAAQVVSTETIPPAFSITATNTFIILVDGGSATTLTFVAKSFTSLGAMVTYLSSLLVDVGATAFLIQDNKIAISSLSENADLDSELDIGGGGANTVFGFDSADGTDPIAFDKSDLTLLRHEIATKGNISITAEET